MSDRDDHSLREHLVRLLDGRQAHVEFDASVADLPFSLQGRKPSGSPYTPWQLLEHVRIAQWDIVEFSRNPDHVSPSYPDGYWPESESPPDETAWARSVEAFRADRRAMLDLVEDRSRDLHQPLAHGSGQTLLREALLVADHNAYHLGQLVLLRKMLGSWDQGKSLSSL